MKTDKYKEVFNKNRRQAVEKVDSLARKACFSCSYANVATSRVFFALKNSTKRSKGVARDCSHVLHA